MTTLPPDPNSPDGLVEIVNPNGLKGRVAPTSLAAQVYRQPPSSQGEAPQVSEIPGDPAIASPAPETPNPSPEEMPINLRPVLARPAKNASAEAWREYATDDRNPDVLSPDEAAEMTRDELVAHYPSEED